MINFRDCRKFPPQDYSQDMKFWWPQCETILAGLYAYIATGDEKYLEMHRKAHDYAFGVFPDVEYGEWFGNHRSYFDILLIFFAVLPIICFITEKKLDYWLSLLAAEVYSFITIFVGNLGTISKLYPLVAAFTLSGYYESTPAEILLSVISMVLCGMISGILIYRLSKRDALQ